MTKSRVDKVLAIDPGKTTGIAWMSQDSGLITLEKSLESGEDWVIPDIRPTLTDWDDPEGMTRLVVEKFVITAATAQKSQEASYALETIGAIKQAARDCGYPLSAIVWQKPADAKNAFDNEKLKKLGLWHRGGDGHALDAIRHGALYLAKVGWTKKNAGG